MILEPWWIIVLGEEAESDSQSGLQPQSLSQELADIFSGWTKFAFTQQQEEFKWFQINHFHGNPDDILGSMVNFLTNFAPFTQANEQNSTSTPLTWEKLNPNSISVVLIGDIRSPTVQTFYHLLGKIIRIRRQQLFGGRDLKSYGFLYIPQGLSGFETSLRQSCLSFLIQLNTLQNERVSAERPFNNIVIVQDKNANVNNPEGFVNLPESKIPPLIAQCILHLAVGNSRIFEENRNSPGNCWTQMGSIALYFDQQHWLTTLAAQVGNSLLEQFKNNEAKPWVDKRTIQAILSEKNFEGEISPANLFKRVVITADRPSFNFSSKIWAYPDKIHPYKFWTPLLLKLYFGFYVKYLPVRLVEYGRLFLARSFQDFQRYLETMKSRILKGFEESPGLESLIQEIAEYQWRHDLLACGLKQYERALEMMREIITRHRNHLKSELFQLEEYSNLMVFPIPRFLKSFYDNAADEFSIEEEKKIVQELRHILSSHPLPLALFVRAILLGIVLFFLSAPFLNWISPTIINLEWVATNPILLAAISFGIPVLIALWRYQVRTLRWIRKLVKKYIASILRHAQSRAKAKVMKLIDELYSELDQFCQKLQNEAHELRKNWRLPEVPASPMHATEFQIPLTGTIDNFTILQQPPEYEIHRFQKTFVHLSEDEQAELMRAALIAVPVTGESQGRLYLWQCILQKNFEEASRVFQDYCMKLFLGNDKDLFYWLKNSANQDVYKKLSARAYPSGVLKRTVAQEKPRYECYSPKGDAFPLPLEDVHYHQIPVANYLSLGSLQYQENLTAWLWGTNFEEQEKIIQQLYLDIPLSVKIILALGSDEQRPALFLFNNEARYVPEDLENEIINYREELAPIVFQ